MASKIENVTQDEIARRAKAWYQTDVELPIEAEIPVAAAIIEETLAADSVAV